MGLVRDRGDRDHHTRRGRHTRDDRELRRPRLARPLATAGLDRAGHAHVQRQCPSWYIRDQHPQRATGSPVSALRRCRDRAAAQLPALRARADDGAPFISDTLAGIRCHIEREVDVGDHVIVLGRVVQLRQGRRPLLLSALLFAAIPVSATWRSQDEPHDVWNPDAVQVIHKT